MNPIGPLAYGWDLARQWGSNPANQRNIIRGEIRKVEASRKRRRTATKAYVDAKIAKLRETKYHKTSASHEIPYDNVTITQLTGISQGDTDVTREGDRITLKNLEFRGFVYNDASAAHHKARVIIFQWLQNDTPANTDILPIDGATWTSYAVLEPWNHDQRSSYKILYDSGVIHLGYDAAAGVGEPSQKVIQVIKNLKGCSKVDYVNGSSTVARGNIYVMALSDATDAANAVSIKFSNTIRYFDG